MSGVYEKATPRPWATGGRLEGNYLYGAGHHIACISSLSDCSGQDGFDPETSEACANAALIVHAVNNIEKLERDNARLREALEKAAEIFEGYALEHYRKAKNAPDGREQHGREVKAATNAAHARMTRSALNPHEGEKG